MSQNGVRSRCFELILYPEDDSHMMVLHRVKNLYRYAFCLHDRDLDEDGNKKKPHYHCIVMENRQRALSSLAKELKIEENYINKVGNLVFALRYLTHMDEKLDDAYHYPITSVVTNEPRLVVLAQNRNFVQLGAEADLIVLDVISKHKSFISVYRECVNLGIADYLRKMGGLAQYMHRQYWGIDEYAKKN